MTIIARANTFSSGCTSCGAKDDVREYRVGGDHGAIVFHLCPAAGRPGSVPQ